jgi:hypothetical protein
LVIPHIIRLFQLHINNLWGSSSGVFDDELLMRGGELLNTEPILLSQRPPAKPEA